MEAKLYIKEDITDWRDEALLDENIIESDDDLFGLVDRGLVSGKIAKATVVSRELGKAPSDIISPNKLLLYTGALAEVASKIRERTVEWQTESGKTFNVPAYIGKIGRPKKASEEEDTGDGVDCYVHSDTQLGYERAYNYLMNVIPGHIMNRLKQIAMNDGDVEAAVDELKAKIDEIVQILE